MTEKKIDARIVKNKRDFKNAFLKLLETQSFASIRTTDICKLAMSSRSTFYKHYLDKYDLLAKIVAQRAGYLSMRITRILESSGNQVLNEVEEAIRQLMEHKYEIAILWEVHEQDGDLQELYRTEIVEAVQKRLNDSVASEFYAANWLAMIGLVLTNHDIDQTIGDFLRIHELLIVENGGNS